jgi:hypothetical protein
MVFPASPCLKTKRSITNLEFDNRNIFGAHGSLQ